MIVCYALKHLVSSWQGPCTHKVGSWSHHLVDNVEDHVDDVEDPGDGVESLVDDGEAMDGLKKHQWPILWSFMFLLGSWNPCMWFLLPLWWWWPYMVFDMPRSIMGFFNHLTHTRKPPRVKIHHEITSWVASPSPGVPLEHEWPQNGSLMLLQPI